MNHILLPMTGGNVLAIREGRKKTVTRRISEKYMKVKAGDILEIQEALVPFLNPSYGRWVQYAADGYIPPQPSEWKWKVKHIPSIYMPREFVRLRCVATDDARQELLQWITPDDAKREGDKERSGFPEFHERGPMCHVDWFRTLWDSINGKTHPWENNPVVVRLAFEVTK